MLQQHVIKVNLPGGYISAGDMYEVLAIAEDAGAQDIRFGNRQQLYFSIDAEKLNDMDTHMLRAGITYEVDADEYPNIISSYVCDTIFSQDSWLKEGVYRDVLKLFNYKPRLKINIVDRHQTFVPFFSGNFNFISSEVSNYWYWYIRFPKTSQYYCWISLVYSDDIPAVSKIAEDVILSNKGSFYGKPHIDEQLFYAMLSVELDVPVQAISEQIELPQFTLPYYEGLNKYGNKYWLGIYRRNELFLLKFLKDACDLCIKTRIGQIYITPWKSLLIKNIEALHRSDWGLILNKHRLNIRHASNELNWQIEDLNADALALKQKLVRVFEQADLRTYGLSFAIKTKPKTGLMGSVVIKKQPSGTFEILHTISFNPNSKEYISHKRRVKEVNLASELINLCNQYYDLSASNNVIADVFVNEKDGCVAVQEMIYECRYCKTVYNSIYGDEFNQIPAGTAFTAISDEYVCPVCESAKDSFELIEKGSPL